MPRRWDWARITEGGPEHHLSPPLPPVYQVPWYAANTIESVSNPKVAVQKAVTRSERQYNVVHTVKITILGAGGSLASQAYHIRRPMSSDYDFGLGEKA